MGNSLLPRDRCLGNSVSGDIGDTLKALRESVAMAWKVTTPMEERRQFVDAWVRGDASVAELCRRFEISRKTGYKWIGRRHDGSDKVFADPRDDRIPTHARSRPRYSTDKV